MVLGTNLDLLHSSFPIMLMFVSFGRDINTTSLCATTPRIFCTILSIYLLSGRQKNMSWILRQGDYLMAPWMCGFRKNLVKRLVTSSRSAARSENASTFVKHLTVLLLSNLCPGSLTFLPSAGETISVNEFCSNASWTLLYNIKQC